MANGNGQNEMLEICLIASWLAFFAIKKNNRMASTPQNGVHPNGRWAVVVDSVGGSMGDSTYDIHWYMPDTVSSPLSSRAYSMSSV